MFVSDYIENSLLDWPGKISSVMFLSGCNFRCPWCHNKELALGKIKNEMHIGEILKKSEKNWIEGFVITGGEPTISENLFSISSEIKKAGFKVKIDTNGSMPDVVQNLLAQGLVDCVAMDIKTSLNAEKYNNACGINVDLKSIEKTIDILLNSSIDCLFRTTVVPGFVDEGDIREIRKVIFPSDRISGKKYVLQKFVPRNSEWQEGKRREKVKR